MVLDTPRATDRTRNRHLARVGLKYKDDILGSHRLELWICEVNDDCRVVTTNKDLVIFDQSTSLHPTHLKTKYILGSCFECI